MVNISRVTMNGTVQQANKARSMHYASLPNATPKRMAKRIDSDVESRDESSKIRVTFTNQ